MENNDGNPNLNEMGKMITFFMNNQAEDDFLGYSPAEMQKIIYNPFEGNSIVRFQKEIPGEVLDQIPLLRIIEFIIEKIVEAGELKLTKTGKLPVKVVFGVYGKYYTEEWDGWEYYNPVKEEDVASVHIARIVLELTRLVKKRNNKLSITKAGIKIIKNRKSLFEEIFKTYTMKFNMGFLDGYEAQGFGNIGFAFNLILLSRYGDEKRASIFYSEKYNRAFPEFIDTYDFTYSTPEIELDNCFSYRIIRIFFRLFNLGETKVKVAFGETVYVKKSAIFDQLFHIAPSNANGMLN